MSSLFFEELEVPNPKYNTGISQGRHGEMTWKMLNQIENVLIREKPDNLLIYGDTNSTMAGALAASKLHIPVIHIEAELRSFNRPIPEEINTIVTDHVSIAFAPTQVAYNNLILEGLGNDAVIPIYVRGDAMYDSAIYFDCLANSSALSTLKIQQ